MGELGTCARCGAAYPWPLGTACSWAESRRARGRNYSRATMTGDLAAWIAREQETRAALGSTPLVQSEVIDWMLAYAQTPYRERMARAVARRSRRGRWATPSELELGRSILMRLPPRHHPGFRRQRMP